MLGAGTTVQCTRWTQTSCCALLMWHTTRDRCGVKLPAPEDAARVRLRSNPHDPNHIFVMVDSGGLHVVDLVSHTVSLLSTPPVPFDMPRDVALVGVDKDTFVVVAALAEGVWHAFDSRTKQWAKLVGWKPSKGEFNHNYLVFAPSLRSFYFHIHNTDMWEAVSLVSS